MDAGSDRRFGEDGMRGFAILNELFRRERMANWR